MIHPYLEMSYKRVWYEFGICNALPHCASTFTTDHTQLYFLDNNKHTNAINLNPFCYQLINPVITRISI